MAGPMAMALISPARGIWGGSERSQELKTPALIKALRRGDAPCWSGSFITDRSLLELILKNMHARYNKKR